MRPLINRGVLAYDEPGPWQLPRFQWRADGALLWVRYHPDCIGDECDVDGCWGGSTREAEAASDVTRAYECLCRNLAVVVALAAAAQPPSGTRYPGWFDPAWDDDESSMTDVDLDHALLSALAEEGP